ncbi:MAG: transketolase [Bacteroidia bacterium]|nr:transketolase [Bacteroidia bacterium]
MNKLSAQEISSLSSQIRRDILRMVHGCKSGHPGGSLGCADFLATLYFHVMEHDPKFNMDGVNEDIFFLSNGHISPVFYSVLARAGYFPVEELKTFRKLNTRLQGHPTTHEELPGVRIASGSLGQGVSAAAGAALAKKLNKDNRLVYVLMGDGEIQEGQNWEAFMFAAHHKIDNLIVTIDYNGQQIDGSTKEVMGLGDDIAEKLKSFGWEILHMDGHNVQNIIDTMAQAKSLSGKGKPIFIVMKTEMGYPVDFMMGSHKWHGVAPNDAELANALSQLPETIGDY